MSKQLVLELPENVNEKIDADLVREYADTHDVVQVANLHYRKEKE